ncbi:MAG: RNA 2',3'-cyclic phosphodiesterase [Candidatus Hydrothermarchaeota archaeon]|nr:MAG: RNA 2',3'-cyclic phosphodiesterase [Candidatus Hydrothermarchaeota archaeon]
MRCFIAIDVSNFFAEVLDELSKIRGLKLVSPENLHITLKFLGEVEESKVEKIHESMRQALEKFDSFSISFKGMGVFPSLRYIRVIWVGVERNRERIIEMQKALEQELEKLNFKREKEFSPHLTLARVKFLGEKQKILKLISKFENVEFGELRVEKVRLKKSRLTPQGPIYTTVREICLR